MHSLSTVAVRQPHILVVEVPGYSQVRMFAEQEIRRRGWIESDSPADADIFLTCGTAGRELNKILGGVWDQLPGPRSRLVVAHPEEVPGGLDHARESLLDTTLQREEALARPAPQRPPPAARSSSADDDGDHGPDHGDTNHDGPEDTDQGPDHGGMDRGSMIHEADQGEMDHGDMNQEGMDHEGMDHGGIDMPMPGGIGLAEAGSDRDGLELDVLHVSLGPVLRYWPAGLVVRCALQGDVITEASVTVLAASSVSAPDAVRSGGTKEKAAGTAERLLSARYCDQAAGLLALMGWERLSQQAFLIRDGLLGEMFVEDAASELAFLVRRVRRSWVLRWSFRDLPGVVAGLDRLLERAGVVLGVEDDPDGAASKVGAGGGRVGLGQVPELIVGLDLFAARLVIASSDLVVTAEVDVEAGHV